MTQLENTQATLRVPTTVIPERYVAVLRTQRCTCCRRTYECSEVFAETTEATTLGIAKRVRRLHRVRTLEWDVPLVQRLGTPETLPFCFKCNEPQVDPNLCLPVPAKPQTLRSATVVQLPTTTPAAKLPEAKPPKRRTPATLDDLLEMMQ